MLKAIPMKWRNDRRVTLTRTAVKIIMDKATTTTKRALSGFPAPSSFDTRTLKHGHRRYQVKWAVERDIINLINGDDKICLLLPCSCSDAIWEIVHQYYCRDTVKKGH